MFFKTIKIKDFLRMDILKRKYRRSPEYRILRFENLDESLKLKLRDLEADPDFYGILEPVRNKELLIKSINKDTALFLLSLSDPGYIPNYVLNFRKSEIVQQIKSLLLDNILEIEIGGKFLAGTAVVTLLDKEQNRFEPANTICTISYDALRYGQMLDIRNALTLAARIYFYNRIPLSEELKGKFESVVKKAQDLRIPVDTWRRVNSKSKLSGWAYWQNESSKLNRAKDWTYKLYLSPKPERFLETLQIAAEVFFHSRTMSFKTGNDVLGILRPDKIVAYYSSEEDLMEAAELLRGKIKGIEPHGIPFTYQLDDCGLLSCGMDPPVGMNPIKWQETESWRLWVANKLAAGLIQAKNERDAELEPWQFALNKVEHEGVDVRTWKPTKMERIG